MVWSLSDPECGFVKAPAFSLEHDLGLVCRLAISSWMQWLHCWLGSSIGGHPGTHNIWGLGLSSEQSLPTSPGGRHFLPELHALNGPKTSQHHNPLDTCSNKRYDSHLEYSISFRYIYIYKIYIYIYLVSLVLLDINHPFLHRGHRDSQRAGC